MSIDRHTTRSSFDTDLDELRSALSRMIFPALQDEVLAALVAKRAPMRLLWRVGSLCPTHLYRSVDEVCADIVRFRATGRVTGTDGTPAPGAPA